LVWLNIDYVTIPWKVVERKFSHYKMQRKKQSYPAPTLQEILENLTTLCVTPEIFHAHKNYWTAQGENLNDEGMYQFFHGCSHNPATAALKLWLELIMENKTCGECKWFVLNPEGRCVSNDGEENANNDCCSFFEEKIITNGDRIRSMSDEELAEHLVYMRVVSWDDEVNWYSVVLRSYCFGSKEEALAATIKELKKEFNNG
jgi:hypothetical protein